MEKRRIVRKSGVKLSKREILKKRRKRKILINRMFIVTILLCILGGIGYGLYILVGSVFDLREIVVEGNTMYSDTEILNVASFKHGEGLLFLDTSEAEKKIYNAFPYVDDVSIHKQLPNTLKVDIATANRQFSIFKDDTFYVISGRGKLLERVSELPSETVELRGLEFEVDEDEKIVYKDSEAEEMLGDINKELENVGLNGIKVIDLSNIGNIVINYEDRISIIIGSKKDLHYKMVTAKEIISNKINQFENGELDLRGLTKDNKSYFTPISE